MTADKTPTPTSEDIAATLATLINTDLNTTLAIMAGLLKGIRENRAAELPAAKPGATALRIEFDRWYRAYKALDANGGGNGTDPLAALLAAGEAAAAK